MSLLASFGIKKSKLIDFMNAAEGDYVNLTVDVSDQTDQWGNNVAVYKQQTKEQREAKAPKEYLGNGKVFWNNGTINNAERK